MISGSNRTTQTTLERRSRRALLPVFLCGAIVQAIVGVSVVGRADVRLRQQLYGDTAADLGNLLLTDAAERHEPIAASFKRIAQSFILLNPGSRIMLRDQNGQTIAELHAPAAAAESLRETSALASTVPLLGGQTLVLVPGPAMMNGGHAFFVHGASSGRQ